MPWGPTPFPGLFSKLLFVDEDRQYTTALVRMEAGARYPSHRHAKVEELFMLEGELMVEGVKMVAGDYCCGAPDSVHGAVYTEAGALFVVLSSQNDVLLE
jgi:quercetin dioxygenase-like cupin family protein